MNRSFYTDDGWGEWYAIMWRGAVKSAMRGRRGQMFLCDLRDAMDAMPEKKLVYGKLQNADGAHCALGTIAAVRGLDLEALDFPDDEYDLDHVRYERLAEALDIAPALAREIMFINDENNGWAFRDEEDADVKRWKVVRAWLDKAIFIDEREQ